MTEKGSKGACALCRATLTKSGMTRHLKSCIQKNAADVEGETIYHLAVEGFGFWDEPYWMHLKMPGNASFKVLDTFLRKTWLECCGHLSSFRIGRTDVGMSRKLLHNLEPGMKLLYEYDFGSTTELLITVAGEFKGRIKKGKIEILARNDNPHIKCIHCSKPATLICPQCIYDDEGWFCDECAEEHDCELGFFLPVLNSPRTGVCGYEG